MNNNQYLNEEKYKRIKKVMKTIAFISLMIGIILIVSAILIHVLKIGEDNWFETKTLQILLFAGGFIFSIMIPFPILFIAHGRDIVAFQTQSMMPVAKEGMKEMGQTAGEMMKEMAPTMGQAASEMMKEMTPVYSEIAKEMAPVYGSIAKEVGKGISEGINEAKQNNEK